MNSSEFFERILHAKLRTAYSYGATDQNNRIFLRVWDDQITPDKRKVRVGFIEDKPGKHSFGWRERNEHIESIRKGATAFGVICFAKIPYTDPSIRRRIKDFTKNRLARLGTISIDEKGPYSLYEKGTVYANIEGYITI
jgi:putative restriction endonuclease